MLMRINEKEQYFVTELFSEMYNFMNLYAQKKVTSRSLAEEAVKETFLIACTRVDELIISSNSKGWLITTLKYVISNIMRSNKHHRIFLSYEISINENEIIEENDELHIDLLYSDLVEFEDYKLVKRKVLDGLSVGEIAQEMGISIEACKKRFQRAKNRVKRYIVKKP